MSIITVELKREKETLNTIRFKEPVAEGTEEAMQVGLLYLPKRTVAALGAPDTITLIISPAAAAIAAVAA